LKFFYFKICFVFCFLFEKIQKKMKEKTNFFVTLKIKNQIENTRLANGGT